MIRRCRVEALIRFGSSTTGISESIGSLAKGRQFVTLRSSLALTQRQVDKACDLRRAPCPLTGDRFAGQHGALVGITAQGEHQAITEAGTGKRMLVRGESGVY